MLVVAAGVVVLACGAASAWAMPPQAMLGSRFTRIFPAATNGATLFDAREATLATKPVKVTVGGVSYLLQVTADDNRSSAATTLSVSLEGLTPTSDAFYDYTFSPSSGIAFSFDRRAGAQAAVNASRAIAPSAIDVSYTATDHQSLPCTLADGSKSHLVFSTGTVSFTAFRFVSGTSPVFGTITKHGAKASFTYDPGCGGTVRVVHICSGPEVIAAGAAGSPQQWIFGAPFGERKPLEGVLATSALTSTEGLDREVLTEVRGSDLPSAVTSTAGATAKVKTTGNLLMSGTANFTSTTAPHVRSGTCRDQNGDKRTYAATVYTGTLSSGSPLLTVNFGTGPLSFSSPKPAKLYLTTLTP